MFNFQVTKGKYVLGALDGIEMRVALEYAKRHNMSVKLVVNEVEEWGDIYENWTGTGIVGNLVFDRGDMGFGNYMYL